ncbi:MAG: FAD:protein FMN transferase [Oscillospiraceae bacterium]|nr:FAD:protein FMN transferase [Oscillospiraceae bacterium]
MLNRRAVSFLLIIAVLCAGGCETARYKRFQTEFTGLFDTATVIIAYAQSADEFGLYAEIIYNRMEELHRLYDIYNAYEGVNNLYTVNQNAGAAPVEVDRDIIDLLLFAREGYDLSGGAVNVAMGPVLRIWHEYREEGLALPPMGALLEASRNTDINDLIIDEAGGTVFLRKPGMSLDVGAVAKSYAAGLAIRAASDAGMISGLLSAGGNVTAAGKPMDGRNRWGVGIQEPEPSADNTREQADTVYCSDTTVSCSGGYQRFYVVDGQAYHHIIDPGALMPANLYKQVAVIHRDAGMADLLSTALFILPYEEGAALAARRGAEALWIDTDGAWRATDGYAAISKTLSDYSASDGSP